MFFDLTKRSSNMKMNILGLIAIAVAISLSAFTSPSKASAKGSGQYWFSVSGNISVSAKTPEANATFIQQSVTPPTESCASGTTHQCVSGFDVSQVNTSTNQLDGSQMPETESQTKN